MDERKGPVAEADDVCANITGALHALDDFVTHAGVVGRELTEAGSSSQLLEATNRVNQARRELEGIDHMFIGLAARVLRLKGMAMSTEQAVTELSEYRDTLGRALESVKPVDQLVRQAIVLATQATHDQPVEKEQFEELGRSACDRLVRMATSAWELIEWIGGDAETIKRSGH